MLGQIKKIKKEYEAKYSLHIQDTGRILVIIFADDVADECAAEKLVIGVAPVISSEISDWTIPYHYDWVLCSEEMEYRYSFNRQGEVA